MESLKGNLISDFNLKTQVIFFSSKEKENRTKIITTDLKIQFIAFLPGTVFLQDIFYEKNQDIELNVKIINKHRGLFTFSIIQRQNEEKH